MIAAGASLETSKQAIELANKYDKVWATVGLHPDEINSEFRITDYELLIKESKVVAVGEVGLDYYKKEQSFDELRVKQKEVFSQFIDLALETGKPLVLHCRSEENGQSAHEDAIEILSKSYVLNPKSLGGVVHSFTGTLDEAKKYLNLGFCLGLNGIITFTDQYDEVVRYTPLEQILLETDAPWLTPVPNRGKRNEPFGVIEVAKKIATLKNISFDEVAQETFANTQNLFKI